MSLRCSRLLKPYCVKGVLGLIRSSSTRLFAGYGIPITPAALARNADEAVAIARPHLAGGTPVVLKVQSPDIVHKSEVGGVRLDLACENAVHEAATEILARRAQRSPTHASRASRFFQ